MEAEAKTAAFTYSLRLSGPAEGPVGRRGRRARHGTKNRLGAALSQYLALASETAEKCGAAAPPKAAALSARPLQ